MNQRYPQSRHTPHGGSEKPTQRKVPACKRAERVGVGIGSQSLRLIMCALYPSEVPARVTSLSSPPPLFPCSLRGLAQFVPIARFSAKEHRARVDGRATARHLHGIIERAVRCDTVKVSAESAGAVASTMFLESLPTRQSGRLAQPDGGAGTPAGRGCHLQGRSAPPSWTTP